MTSLPGRGLTLGDFRRGPSCLESLCFQDFASLGLGNGIELYLSGGVFGF